MTKESSMPIRKTVLVVGLLFTLQALCAEEPEMQMSGESVVASPSELLCSRCVVKLAPNSQIRVAARRFEIAATGLAQLEGVRITFQNGDELRSERVTVKTSDDGAQELSGDEFRFIKAALR
jgi:hypothetical protein